MSRYLVDCETNGLLDKMDTIHSLVLKDLHTDKVISCHDHGGEYTISDGMKLLSEADEIIGHNVLKFDIPALQIVYPWFNPTAKITDTLILSRLIWSNLKDDDYKFRKKKRGKKFPGYLCGRHSLEAWGQRLHFPKDDYKALAKAAGRDPWAEWWPTMQTYCERDVEVTHCFLKLIESKNYSAEAIKLEHDFAHVIHLQELTGFNFDRAGAERLYSTLAKRREELTTELQEVFPPRVVKTPFTPKANNSKYGYKKGVPTFKSKTIVFNPGSRDHIAAWLHLKYGWEPREFTGDGKAKIDEKVLEGMDIPEAPLLQEYLMIQKRIGQLAEGPQAWLKLERNGRIYGQVITNGAVTGRCTHMKPNVAQVPSGRAPYGDECRALFIAPKGYRLVGADASGLELRALAHFMARYDGGAYVREVLEGDIHTVNQLAAGLPTRDNAKTFIYAFLYGAGDAKIGDIIGAGSAEGKRIKKKFLDQTPALKKLRKKVTAQFKLRKGKLTGIDGRVLHCRSSHSALNTLLQSAGALLVKKATVLLYEDLKSQGLVHGQEWALVAHVHDELQIIAKEGIEDHVGKCAVNAIRAAGEHFKWRCALDGEYKVGQSWANTH